MGGREGAGVCMSIGKVRELQKNETKKGRDNVNEDSIAS